MTTLWRVEPIWCGETVAVMAGGPSMSQQAADNLRKYRSIVVNYALRLAPWAEMLVALDGDWPDEFAEFKGMRVTGVADDQLDALYIGPRYEKIEINPGHVIETINSGLTAIRVAALMGAAKIILCGFDPEVQGHFTGYPVGGQSDDGEPYPGVTAGLAAVVEELKCQGIEIERI